MRTNMLEFLFGKAAARDEAALGEQIVKLFEDADEIEGVELTAQKKPLADALKAMGINGAVETDAQWAEIHCHDDAEYHKYVRLLSDPDAMHKLAEMGWVMARCGDIGMGNEPADYKIGFIEIATTQSGEADKPNEKINAILKQGQEFATTPVAQDDDLNPVEREQGKPEAKLSGKTTGVGKPKDGADPKGTPKGSTDEALKPVRKTKRAESMVDRLLSDPIQEMTGTGSMGTFEGGGSPPVIGQTGLKLKKRPLKLKGKPSDALRP